jgi:hypothetical protein
MKEINSKLEGVSYRYKVFDSNGKYVTTCRIRGGILKYWEDESSAGVLILAKSSLKSGETYKFESGEHIYKFTIKDTLSKEVSDTVVRLRSFGYKRKILDKYACVYEIDNHRL